MDHPYPDMVDSQYKYQISYYKNNNNETQGIWYLVSYTLRESWNFLESIIKYNKKCPGWTSTADPGLLYNMSELFTIVVVYSLKNELQVVYPL